MFSSLLMEKPRNSLRTGHCSLCLGTCIYGCLCHFLPVFTEMSPQEGLSSQVNLPGTHPTYFLTLLQLSIACSIYYPHGIHFTCLLYYLTPTSTLGCWFYQERFFFSLQQFSTLHRHSTNTRSINMVGLGKGQGFTLCPHQFWSRLKVWVKRGKNTKENKEKLWARWTIMTAALALKNHLHCCPAAHAQNEALSPPILELCPSTLSSTVMRGLTQRKLPQSNFKCNIVFDIKNHWQD